MRKHCRECDSGSVALLSYRHPSPSLWWCDTCKRTFYMDIVNEGETHAGDA